MSAPPLVSYFKGMFAQDDTQPLSLYWEEQATVHHECGHAVLMYAFGQGLSYVGVGHKYSADNSTVALVGRAQPLSRGGRERVRINYGWRRSHFVQGVITAAGPVAERRYRHQVGIPMHILGASEGDHQLIDSRGKVLERHGRDRAAYERMVWYAAQKLIARDDIWRAIEAVAELFELVGGEENDDGDVWTDIEPRDLYRRCRQEGVTRGLLNQAA